MARVQALGLERKSLEKKERSSEHTPSEVSCTDMSRVRSKQRYQVIAV